MQNIQNSRMSNFQIFLLALTISMGPIFWFPYIGKVLVIKYILAALLLILNPKILQKWSFWGIVAILVIIHLIRMSFNETFYYIFLFIDTKIFLAYIIFEYGKDYKDNTSRLFSIVYKIVLIYCILFLIFAALGTFEYLPVSVSGEKTNGEYRMIPFQKGGWGFGGTQWSTCLMPFTLLFIYENNNNKTKLFVFVTLLMTIHLLSGCRSGIFVSSLAILYSLTFTRNEKSVSSIAVLIFVISIVSWVLIHNTSYYKFDADDITTYRLSQWQLLPEIVSQHDLLLGTEKLGADILSDYDSNMIYSFHCSYVKLVLGLGLIGFFFLYVIFDIVYKSACLIRNTKKDPLITCTCSIIIFSFFVAFSEPNPIVESPYWPLWWFSAGYIVAEYNRIIESKKQLFMFQSNSKQIAHSIQ